MSIDQIRKQYGVPAKRGGRVEYTGGKSSNLGTITGTSGPHLLILLDGSKHSMPFHPTWEVRYLDASAQPPADHPMTKDTDQ
jgi:hypothetical protein